jgi:hypothetical protein
MERTSAIMKKLLLVGLLIGLSFAINANVRPGNTAGYLSTGYEYIQLEVKGVTAPTSSALIWYGDGIAGYSSIDFYGMEVSSGNVPTTISAQLLFANGAAVSIAAQTITSGTDLTDLRSGFYKFSLPAYSVTRNVTFNFLIAD